MSVSSVDKDYFRNIHDIIVTNGFVFNKYYVTTLDGYILQLFRMRKPGLQRGAPVVFYLHGVIDTSLGFVVHQPEKAPGFQLARDGYDVWMGNSRGNTFSKDHVRYTFEDKEYWDFSWKELGEYDLPAMIDLTLAKTGVKNLTYMAHSLGTTQMFSALANRHDLWKDKINLFVSFAPVITMNHSSFWLLKYLAFFTKQVYWLLTFFGFYYTPGEPLAYLSYFGCLVAPGVCIWMEHFISKNIMTDDHSRLLVWSSHLPSRISLKIVANFGQEYWAPGLRDYEYPTAQENLRHYGQSTAPVADLSVIDVPMALFVGKDDTLSSIEDNRAARKMFKKGTIVAFEEIDGGHSSFFISKDMSYFEKVKELVRKYNPK